MSVPLPNLDDRRWSDLVDEGRSLIPLYAPGWTDHNAHDPGVTLIELLAWLTEMDIYSLNRISDEHKRKFLSLVGVAPYPPRQARSILSFELKPNQQAVWLPAGTEAGGADPFGVLTTFRTSEKLRVSTGKLAALLLKDSKGYHDLTGSLERGEAVGVFGPVPEQGAEIYFGFTDPLAITEPVSLYFTFAGIHSGAAERERLIEETLAQTRSCQPPSSLLACEWNGRQVSREEQPVAALPTSHVRVRWQFLAEDHGQKRWVTLDCADVASRSEIEDDTRSFTLDGRIAFRLPSAMAKSTAGQLTPGLFYVRCRFEAGAYDAPPLIQTISYNGVAAEQASPGWSELTITKGAATSGTAPKPGDLIALRFTLNDSGAITSLDFGGSEGDPRFKVLEYNAATQNAQGHLVLEAILLGIASEIPFQQHQLPGAPAVEESIRLYTLEGERWRHWEKRPDFDASRAEDAHIVINPENGVVGFGNGDHGRVPQSGAPILATCDSTRAADGNLGAGKINRLLDSLHNRAFIENFAGLAQRIAVVTNRVSGSGGADAETLEHAIARAIELVRTSWRAVTLDDYEWLAKRTPGTRIARASARANLHPSFPCFKAPGLITLIILPDMPAARPSPSRELKRAVSAYLHRRRVIGTRVEVVGPEYVELAVRASVKAGPGVSKSTLQEKISAALNRFFDPLGGGPDKTGWPFGRDVYRSEVMQVIEEVPGVDHVLSLELLTRCGRATCGNVCLGPTSLVGAEAHEIKVI